METNPYAAPGAVVEDVRAFGEMSLDARKATRWQRLGAAFVDGLLIGVCSFPLNIWWALHNPATRYGNSHLFASLPVTGPVFIVISVLLLLGLIACNLVLLDRNGQTIGKRMAGIKIVRTDGSAVAVSRVALLRWLPLGVAARIPFIGGFIGLADALVIFGSDKRCIHDYIADTIVIVD